jgi:hypothetical protein
MLRHVFAVAVLVVTRCAFADVELRQEPPQHVVIEGRDLKAYVDGGEFTSAPMTSGKITHVDALRRFIWQHWSEKTRGYVRIAMSGIDSTQTTHVFIEPADGSKWRVALRGVNHGYPCPTCGRWFLSDARYASSVQWISKKDGKKLTFKDSRGKEVLAL